MIAEFINANELGLAREQMADVLSEDAQPLSADERADMLALVDRMQMGERVPRALAFCPQREVGQALGGMSVRARPPRPRVSHWHVAVVKNAPVSTMAVSSTLSPWNEQDGKSDVRQVVQRIEFLLDGQPLSLLARDEYIATPESYLTVFEVDPPVQVRCCGDTVDTRTG